jgi:antitoxin component HigA of HigAB toxin-antitoxin module
MNITPIRNENDYQKALLRLELIFDAKKGSMEGDELEILSILIDRYENEHFPIGMPDPIEAIKIPHGTNGHEAEGFGRSPGIQKPGKRNTQQEAQTHPGYDSKTER